MRNVQTHFRFDVHRKYAENELRNDGYVLETKS